MAGATTRLDLSGTYPVLEIGISTTPRIAALIASGDRRQRKRGLRLLQRQQRALTWGARGTPPDQILGQLLSACGFS